VRGRTSQATCHPTATIPRHLPFINRALMLRHGARSDLRSLDGELSWDPNFCTPACPLPSLRRSMPAPTCLCFTVYRNPPAYPALRLIPQHTILADKRSPPNFPTFLPRPRTAIPPARWRAAARGCAIYVSLPPVFLNLSLGPNGVLTGIFWTRWFADERRTGTFVRARDMGLRTVLRRSAVGVWTWFDYVWHDSVQRTAMRNCHRGGWLSARDTSGMDALHLYRRSGTDILSPPPTPPSPVRSRLLLVPYTFTWAAFQHRFSDAILPGPPPPLPPLTAPPLLLPASPPLPGATPRSSLRSPSAIS